MKFRRQMSVTRLETWEVEADDIGQANAKFFRAEDYLTVQPSGALEQWKPYGETEQVQ